MWTFFGSSNWDPRSLRLNFEFNVECYDPHLASRLMSEVNRQIARSQELTLAEVDGRSLPIKLRDGLARLLSLISKGHLPDLYQGNARRVSGAVAVLLSAAAGLLAGTRNNGLTRSQFLDGTHEPALGSGADLGFELRELQHVA